MLVIDKTYNIINIMYDINLIIKIHFMTKLKNVINL